MNKIQLKIVISAFRKLGKKNSVPVYHKTGVCHNIWALTSISFYNLPNYNCIVRRWKHFSGDIVYPIPYSKLPNMSPINASLYCSIKGLMWTGEYGEMRRKFARYLAREYTKMLKQLPD